MSTTLAVSAGNLGTLPQAAQEYQDVAADHSHRGLSRQAQGQGCAPDGTDRPAKFLLGSLCSGF